MECIAVKISYYGIIAILLVVTAVALAGCTTSKTTGTGSDSAASTVSATTSSSAPSAAATTAATCPTVNGKGAWDGAWSGYYSYNKCADLRGHFNPPDAKLQDYWGGYSSDGTTGKMDVTFVQNGCDVTGKASLDDSGTSTHPCQVAYTGTASGTELKGTWKAYCNVDFGSVDKHDNGVFDIYMEPGLSNTFIGSFTCDADKCRQGAAANCPDANGNWVGKRA